MQGEKHEEKKQKSFSEREEEILKFWEENKIFEKSLEKRKNAPRFVFYDGPPFATGLPHYGHILASIIKDAIPRYQTMKGKYVERRWGWDCHGLPLENIIEQELKLKTKKDIETYGIGKFNRRAEEGVLRYADEWKKVIPRIGRWVDMERDYKTMDWKYSETIWWIFKTLYDKTLIYEGHKSMHVCPRCETTLANFEVTQGYKDIKDISVMVKFELEDEPNTFLLAWTTTPWTLPGNVALAVHPGIEYVKFEEDGNSYIAAKNSKVVPEGAKIEKIDTKKLIGKKYKPLFDYYANDPKLENRESGWKIYPADFVTTDEGTGIVHVAPAFGEEDMNLGKEKKLPFVQHISMDGKCKPEVKDFAGLPVKPKGDPQATDKKIIEYLEKSGTLFSKEEITHSYPHCWRCDTPLLNYAAVSWFVNVAAIRDDLVKINKKITWVPEHIKEGRFGKWLEGARDWAISRSRFWGAPLPVWRCKKCGKQEIIGSLQELEQKIGRPQNRYFIMRHGRAETNIKGVVISGNDGYGLTEEGRRDVEQAAKKFLRFGIKPDLVVCSPVNRAKESAKIAAKILSVNEIQEDERLREIHFGIFERKTGKEYEHFFSSFGEWFTKRPQGGEHLRDVATRVFGLLEEYERQYKGKTIFFVGHDAPLWMLAAAGQGLDNEGTKNLRKGKRYRDFLRYGEIYPLKVRQIPRNRFGIVDVHRPFIDAIQFPCVCGGVYERIPEVFDCWFESGSMPYGQWHYPFENKKIFDPKKGIGFPADFIDEGLDQTRGWFYSLLVLAVALFGKTAYRHVNAHGTILAQDGAKMSKRLKNYPDPMEVVAKFGADSIRFTLLSSPVVHWINGYSRGSIARIAK
ncbi:MAG: isoleucyl-tRNA synthetase [Parcubacteria group bacterium Gr01-1014_33]|nr:MAG: isoleucyl-tRNA synthetase [Parcubacteria group bacterium Gr01-1014_33]